MTQEKYFHGDMLLTKIKEIEEEMETVAYLKAQSKIAVIAHGRSITLSTVGDAHLITMLLDSMMAILAIRMNSLQEKFDEL